MSSKLSFIASLNNINTTAWDNQRQHIFWAMDLHWRIKVKMNDRKNLKRKKKRRKSYWPETGKQQAPFYLWRNLPSKHSDLMNFATLTSFHCTCSNKTLWRYPTKQHTLIRRKKTIAERKIISELLVKPDRHLIHEEVWHPYVDMLASTCITHGRLKKFTVVSCYPV